MLKRRLDPQTWKEIAAKYEAGATTPALCNEYGLSKAGVLGILRDQNVALRRRPLASEQVAEAARLYRYGFSIMAIANHLDTSFNNVRQNLERLGVERRPRGGSRKKRANADRTPLTDEQQISAVLLYTAGGSLPAVASAVGASTDRVRACLVEMDITIRSKGRPTRDPVEGGKRSVVNSTASQAVEESA